MVDVVVAAVEGVLIVAVVLAVAVVVVSMLCIVQCSRLRQQPAVRTVVVTCV